MNNRHLVEPASDMIVQHIQDNIAAALDAIRPDRAQYDEAGIPTPVPKNTEYYIAKNYQAFLPPSIFVVCDSIDFKKSRGANHINATAKYGIATIVDGINTDVTTRKAWRYQAALSQVLDNVHLTSSDKTFSIRIIVQGAQFSEDYSPSTKEENPAKAWRKGFQLNCDVEFYEVL